MSLIMKDLKNLHKKTGPELRAKLATAVLLGLLVIILALEYSPAAAQEDLMISPDMQSYIENYGVTVDECGVE